MEDIMNITSNNLAKLIKTRRKELKLSQSEVHAKLGWQTKNTQYLSNIELGKCQMPPKHIKKLSEAIGIKPEMIIFEMTQDYRDALNKEVLK